MRPLSIIYLYQNCGLYLRAACINYFSYYLRLVFEGGLYLKAASILENTVIIGDFNARSNNWCFSDKTTYEGKKRESLTSQCGFKQVISDPSHILETSSSCIDLIFTSQPNLVMNSDVHSSLHLNCHHQIIHAKFNFKFSIHLHMNESSLSRCK